MCILGQVIRLIKVIRMRLEGNVVRTVAYKI
jgi:hypothetical protein